jgi:hypothetical protein
MTPTRSLTGKLVLADGLPGLPVVPVVTSRASYPGLLFRAGGRTLQQGAESLLELLCFARR